MTSWNTACDRLGGILKRWSQRWFPALVFVLVAAAMLAFSELQRISVPLPDVHATSTGAFGVDGSGPSRQPAPDGLRSWSSFRAAESDRGSLVFGPFSAPAVIGFRGMGNPRAGGSGVELENTVTGERVRLPVDDWGEQWRRITFAVPRAWRGVSVRLHVRDEADGEDGWFAVTEPYAVPRWASWGLGVWQPLNAILFTGWFVLLGANAAAVWLWRWRVFRGAGLVLLSWAVLALAGHGLFWVYFFNARVGNVTTDVLLFLMAVVSFRPGAGARLRAIWRDVDWHGPVLLMAIAAVALSSLLYLFSTDWPFADLAANRYREHLPGDNEIPRVLAEDLRNDRPLKPFITGWQSSDRPPLQSGWLLLFGRVASLLGTHSADASHFAAVWLQLLWIPAAWWWLRRVGATPRQAALVIVAILPGGFFLINTVFVWPKLAAGGLMVGAFVAWFLPAGKTPGPAMPEFALGGGLAGLAWLAHGGIAFGLLGCAPLVVAWWRRAHAARWLAAAAVFLLLATPWLAYQKIFDPPGDRLIKWHLGGASDVDDRGALETIVDSYRKTPVSELVGNRVQNLRALVHGPWRELLRFDVDDPVLRRDSEFFYTFYALGWWNLGFVALTATALPRFRKRIGDEIWSGWMRSLAWVAATLFAWIALMFLPWYTVIHQGSYTVLLVLFPLLAFALWRWSPPVFAAVVAAQLMVFPAIWMSAPPEMSALARRPDAVVAIVLSAVALILVSLLLRERDVVESAADITEPT